MGRVKKRLPIFSSNVQSSVHVEENGSMRVEWGTDCTTFTTSEVFKKYHGKSFLVWFHD